MRLNAGNWLEKIIYFIPIGVFLAFVLYFSWSSYEGKVSRKIVETKALAQSVKDLSNGFEKTLQENFYRKYDFINLAGGTAATVGLNTFNRIQKLSNGYLSIPGDSRGDIPSIASKIINLNNFLQERGINFLFVMAPAAFAMPDAKFAPGYAMDYAKTTRDLVSKLEANSVQTLPMAQVYTRDGWTLEDVFFKTDHHWRPLAALKAAQESMKLLSSKKWATYNPQLLDISNLEIKSLKNRYLGYFGKRTGKWFAGLDDIDIYSFKSPHFHQHWGLTRSGWFYRPDTLDKEAMVHKNFFTEDPYLSYLSRDLPMRVVKTADAPNKKRLLVLGDSFHKPWQYFINSQFEEIYSLDLRHYSDGTLAEFVNEIRPDLVVMVISSRSWGERLWNFGLEAYEQILAKTNRAEKPISFDRVEVVSPEEAKNKFSLLDFEPEPGATYTLTVDSTRLTGKGSEFVQMTLQNLSSNKPIVNRYFDPNSDRRQRWIFTVPNTQNDTFGIYLYSGTKGTTQRSSASLEAVSIRRGIHEDEATQENSNEVKEETQL
ncbi:MAG: hypothetical protein LUC43_04375 [Burkholderiales bacterium]|nr:hypothetical protein [Burkholderiales bacterium]